MKKVLFLFAIIISSCTVFVSCSSDNDEDAVNLCEDGIQNGSETGIDCGGDCQSCEDAYLCNATNSELFYPFDIIEKWTMPATTNLGTGTYTYTYVGTEDINSQTYYKMNVNQGLSGWDYFLHYRINSEGEVFRRNSYDDEDYLLVSDIKPVGYEWFRPLDPTETFKIISKDASLETSLCTYTGLIKIEERHDGELWATYYYKKGLGLVFEKTYGILSSARSLQSIDLQ